MVGDEALGSTKSVAVRVQAPVQQRGDENRSASGTRGSATVAARCFDQWEALIAARLRADGWPEDSLETAASAALALIEGSLLLARVSGQPSHLAHAKRAALALLAAPSAPDES